MKLFKDNVKFDKFRILDHFPNSGLLIIPYLSVFNSGIFPSTIFLNFAFLVFHQCLLLEFMLNVHRSLRY